MRGLSWYQKLETKMSLSNFENCVKIILRNWSKNSENFIKTENFDEFERFREVKRDESFDQIMDEGSERDKTWGRGGLPTLPGLYHSTIQPSRRGFF
jgi:hypothetical protein